MRFGIIGAGMIGRFHARAIAAMENGELYSVFDLQAERARELSKEFGCKAFVSFEEFLSDPELELVTIGTPSGAHRDPAIAALHAGKHVICEKPLEITAEVQVCGTKGSAFLADNSFRVWDFAETKGEDATIRETLMQGAGKGVGAKPRQSNQMAARCATKHRGMLAAVL